MENHGKYGEFIYTHTDDTLFVNLFVASELTWKDKNITVTQNTAFPDEEGGKLTIHTPEPLRFTLAVRHPVWAAPGTMKVLVDGKNYAEGSAASSYILIDRTWNDSDVVTIETPMRFTVEEMPNVPNYISILRGPIVLGAKTGTADMPGLVANADRWAHVAGGPLSPVYEAPFILGTKTEVLQKVQAMRPVPGKPFTYTDADLFTQPQDKALVFEPFYRIHDSRYMMYWLSMTEREYDAYKKEINDREQAKITLDQRTVDAVNTGEQQPEADHFMKSQNSHNGVHQGEPWRDAVDGGFFQYELRTGGNENLSLMVRYWGNDGGPRTFDIMIDDSKLVTENIGGKWKKDVFVDVEYPVPASMVKGKSSIVVKFQCDQGNIAGGVFYLRLLKTVIN
jgi:hypothetical protein